MRRREFVALLAGAAIIGPLRAAAQQTRSMPLIGLLGLGPPDNPEIMRNLAGLRRGLDEGGFVEGRNIAIEYRWAYGDELRLPSLARELVARGVDVIVTEGPGASIAAAAKAATRTIPVVFHTPDAVADGLVGNLARPDANLTGVSMLSPELWTKQLELLAEVIPKSTVFASLVNPAKFFNDAALRKLEDAARSKGVKLEMLAADTVDELSDAFAEMSRRHVGGVVIRANSLFAGPIVDLAARYRIPAVYNQRAYPDRGGLLSYGVNIPAVYVIKGRYVARLLNGARVADLPVQQPTKFELVINLNTAKALGLTVPQSILARADEVIE